MTWTNVVFALVVSTGAIRAQADLAARLEAVAKAYGENRGFMGSVLVAKGGTVILEKGYGMANLEWDIPNGADTRFRLGSITKQFTATAILQLQEQGKLNASDSISKYVEGIPDTWKPVTIHHLLTHTSGIPSYTDDPDFRKPEKRRVPLKPLEIVMLSKDKPLEFQPGEKMKYDNTGYVLLGYIVEKVSGEKYDDYLRKHVFGPLDMNESGYDWTEPLIKHRASGYVWGAKTYTNADFLDMSLPAAAGSLYSTVRDLYRWDRALYTDKVLPKKSRDLMFTPFKNDYAYGWGVKKGPHGLEIAHGGGINGFATYIGRYPDQDAVVIVLSNVQNGYAPAVASAMGSALFGDKVEYPWERKEITVDPKVLERYSGNYKLELPPGGPMTELPIAVTVEGGKLMVQAQGQPKVQAFAQTESKFFLKVVEATFEFTVGDDGKATQMTLHQGGATMTGKRVGP